MNKTLIILALLAIFISGCQKSSEQLPDTFAINFYSDGTSSGASRYYNAVINFKDNKLIDGYARHNGGDMNGDWLYECVADTETMTWKDKNTNGPCDERLKFIPGKQQYTSEFPPLTKEGIQDLLDSERLTLLSKDPNCHYNVCYELILPV